MAKKHCWISNIAARRLTGVKAVCLYCREVRYDNLRGGTCPGALLAQVPKLDKPYSRLLADIESKRRIHKQSTWGPECDPVDNVCGTPMCTAGHLVNMAGEIGYKLKDKFGWAGAARLIHQKSRPYAPPQNFGSIPQEFAMAYIRERAKEES